MENKLKKAINFISVIAVGMITVPISYILLGGIEIPGFKIFVPAAVFGCVLLGYFLQHFFAVLLGQRLSNDGFDSSKNGIMNGFKISYAIIPIFLIILSSFLVKLLFDKYLYYMFINGIYEYYEELSIYPYEAMIIYIMSALSGIVIWFYPVERLSNIYVLIAGGAIFFIEFLISLVSNSAWIVGISFAVFLMCMIIIYNQSNLQKTYRGTVVSAASLDSRLYNIFLSAVLLVCLFFASIISYIIVSGVYLLLRMLFYLVLYKLFYNSDSPVSNNNYEYVDPESSAAQFTRNVMDANSQYIIAMFFTIVLIIVIAIIGIKTGFLVNIIKAIKNAIAEFFLTITNGIDYIKNSDEITDNTYNYKDQKKKLQQAEIRDYNYMAENTETYKGFLHMLSKLPDYEAQISYAYSVLVSICKRLNSNLKISDTPREIRLKVTHIISENEINQITKDFEEIKYAEYNVSSVEAAAVLNRICNVIKRYIF